MSAHPHDRAAQHYAAEAAKIPSLTLPSAAWPPVQRKTPAELADERWQHECSTGDWMICDVAKDFEADVAYEWVDGTLSIKAVRPSHRWISADIFSAETLAFLRLEIMHGLEDIAEAEEQQQDARRPL